VTEATLTPPVALPPAAPPTAPPPAAPVAHDAPPAAPATVRKTAEERKAALALMIANVSAQGYRVESQSDFQAVVVKGKRINHALHIIVSLLTVVWLLGYLVILASGGEKRELMQVDEWGNVARQQL
jgi:hypothetical protein